MSSTYSDLKFELIGLGDQSNTWGTTTNVNLGTAIEEAIAGRANANFTSDANLTLTLTDSNATQVARNFILNVTSSVSLTQTRDLIVPTIDKPYIVENNTTGSQSIVVKTSAGTGITIPNGKTAIVYAKSGGNVVSAANYFDAITTPSATITGGSITGITDLALADGGTGASLTDPNADRIMFWDDSAGAVTWLTAGTGLSITGTTLSVSTSADVSGPASSTDNAVARFDGTTGKLIQNSAVTIDDTTGDVTGGKYNKVTITAPATGAALTIADGKTLSVSNTLTLTGTDSSSVAFGAGGTAQLAGKQTMWVPATAMISQTTNGAGTTIVEGGTNQTMLRTLAFDQTTTEYAQFSVRMPKSWNASTVTFAAVWTANSTSTNSVIWGVKAKALGNDESYDGAWGSAVTVTDNNTSTAYQIHLASESSAVTIANASASEWVVFQVYRDVADTLAADALLIGINIYYTTSAANDA